jgi:prepilin signal peptidase PulO-like enzyme (type II secretory pathway)
MSRRRAALAGAGAATLWAGLERIDMRLLANGYSDVELLGKLATRTRWWPVAGLALHAANGAVFGLAFEEVRRLTKLPARPLALALALGEHVALFPLGILVDRKHPARRELALTFSARSFAQATIRHAAFGVALGAFYDE